jgi:ATP-dependent DNA ligase
VLAAGTRLIQGGAEPQPPLLLFKGEAFDDGAALFEAVCERELEGVVAKRRSGRYRPGERGWVKIKNRNYWRHELDRETALNMNRVRQFV